MAPLKLPRPDLAALGLCALLAVGIIVLAVLRQPIPDVLTYLATAALSAGAGLSLNSPGTVGTETLRSSIPPASPRGGASSSPAPRSSGPVPAPRAAAAAASGIPA
jgi:hypothetical protein